jgi:hypothetical protein
MDMIGGTARLSRRAAEIFQNTNAVGMQCRSDLASDHGLTVLGAEDDMHQTLGE